MILPDELVVGEVLAALVEVAVEVKLPQKVAEVRNLVEARNQVVRNLVLAVVKVLEHQYGSAKLYLVIIGTRAFGQR